MNEKEYEVAGFIIEDDFNLPLFEDSGSADFYSTHEIHLEVVKRIKELNRLGYNISPGQIIEYEIHNRTSPTASIKPAGYKKYKFSIARLAARKRNEKYFDTIIYHELCHVLQIDYLFETELCIFSDGKFKKSIADRPLINILLSDKGGHTDFWKTFTNNVNHMLKVDPPIEEVPREEDLIDIFLESTFSAKKAKEYEDSDFDGFSDYFPEVMK